MSASTSKGFARFFSALLNIWALSPLVLGILVGAAIVVRPGHFLSGRARVYRVTWGDSAGVVPTPDATRRSLRHELPSGGVLYQRLGAVESLSHGAGQSLPALVLELTGNGLVPGFELVRSPFFGPDDLDGHRALSATLGHEPDPLPVVRASTGAHEITLHLDGDGSYRQESLITSVRLLDARPRK